MGVRDALNAYSNWLDGEGLLPKADDDNRSHDDLVTEFVKDWEAHGREPLVKA